MSIKNLTHKALNTATAYGNAIDDLRRACAKLTYEAARAEILPAVASFYKVSVVDGKGKAAGTKVFDREAAQYEALAALVAALAQHYPISAIAGHEHVAPGRKADPGAGFDWAALQARLAGCSAQVAPEILGGA